MARSRTPPLPPVAAPCAERRRLAEDAARTRNWKRWGPYLAERQWGTVREDYSHDGNAWAYFPHEHARSRAYRWGEDGLLGFTDRQCRLCFALALWNERDPILKERLFGLSSLEGNHGEDCKELYYYLDATPTASYCKALYKYPQAEFPYERLRAENARRGLGGAEFELLDTGVFDGDRYFDVFVEYAKADPDDILIRIGVVNRGPVAAPLHLLPTFWFRNTWIWGCQHEGCTRKPSLRPVETPAARASGRRGRPDGARGPLLRATHETLGRYLIAFEEPRDGTPVEWLFTENESHSERLWGTENHTPYVKDAFHACVVEGRREAVNPRPIGTKAAAHLRVDVPAGGRFEVRLRFRPEAAGAGDWFGAGFDETFCRRIEEADAFHASLAPPGLDADRRQVLRQAHAGLIWTKQFYHYSVHDWLQGDRDIAAPPASRLKIRNTEWRHFFARDVLSMPDKWEYPWFAAWDLGFHMIPFANVDPDFAKHQLLLLLREWYLHPNGQLPAYEWEFSDVNPPVHAWACWRVYKMTGAAGARDLAFLERAFHKLLMNFTWWVNRKDPEGNNIFGGGFLGMDNIGVFDRSKPLPVGGRIAQADGTAWMAFYCTTMLAIALELARHNAAYEDVASKFFEHFVAIVDAMHAQGDAGLWDARDGFYYDRLVCDGCSQPLRIRSMVGLVPLFAVEVLHTEDLARLPGFSRRLQWFLIHRRDLRKDVSLMEGHGPDRSLRLLAIPSRERLESVLRYLLDENEFLSPFGIRSLSRHHARHPYEIRVHGETRTVRYVPAESDSHLFGGNSNWRGPVWLPVNFLLVEALERYHRFYGDGLTVECPRGSGVRMNLREAGDEIARRLTRLFLRDADGHRPCHGGEERYARDPAFRDLLLFHEYFDGDTGRGLGASHQTGWTALAAKLIEDLAKRERSQG